jgi:hypothetical protein
MRRRNPALQHAISIGITDRRNAGAASTRIYDNLVRIGLNYHFYP